MLYCLARVTYQMARDIHEPQVIRTRQLHLRSLEQTIMFLADEESIIYRFLTYVSHTCIRAYHSDIIRVGIQLIQGYMLADEYSNPNSTHVESVEESLDRSLNLFTLLVVLL